MLWKMAVRGVASNRRRTVFLSLSLALSSFVLAVGASLVTSFESSIEAGLRRGFTGDLQVYHGGNPPPTLTSEAPAAFRPVADAAAVARRLRDDTEVRSVSPLSRASGILLVGDVLAPVVLVGMDPEQDRAALERLLPAGVPVPASSSWILLGRPQAERLRRAGPSSEVTVLLPTADGLFAGDVLPVAGTYLPPGLPFVDEFLAFVPLPHLQRLTGDVGYPGSLVVRLRDGADLAAARVRLERDLRDAGLPLEVATWRELAGDLLGSVEVGHYLVGTGFVLLLLVVVLGIVNTVLVLLLDRRRAIGLMRALGTARRPIVWSLVGEVALLSLASSAVGAAAGGLLCAWLARTGIPASTEAMAYAFGGPRFFPEVHAGILLGGCLLVALVGPLVSLLPAWRASASDPAHVLRTPA